MSRKDSKGRVLKQGESERKDGRYQFRYTNILGKRKTIYANTLADLRDKEMIVIRSGVMDMPQSNATILYYLKRYIKVRSLKKSTRHQYESKLTVLEKTSFIKKSVDKISVKDAKSFLLELKKERNLKQSTIGIYKTMLQGAFDIAYEEEEILRNPFNFKLDALRDEDEEEKSAIALSKEQQSSFMQFIQTNRKCSKYYNEIAILLGTGLRIGEFCGLTDEELDFENLKIDVKHQLDTNSYDFVSPKTSSGVRSIPMSTEVEKCLRDALAIRKSKKVIPLHQTDIPVFMTNGGKPYYRSAVYNHVKQCIKVYNRYHEDNPLPMFSPHSLRHTFCTNMVAAGATPKDLQYIMGHSTLEMTMDYYTHYNWDLIGENTKMAVNS